MTEPQNIFINFEVVSGGVHEHGSNWSVGVVYISFNKNNPQNFKIMYIKHIT